ncbi:MAG: hypothetical protein ACRCS8_00380 [Brevinema sp.]
MKKALAIMLLFTIGGCANSPSESGVNETLAQFIGGATIISDSLNINGAYTDEGYISQDAMVLNTLDNWDFIAIESSVDSVTYEAVYSKLDPVLVRWKLSKITARGGKIEMFTKYPEGFIPSTEGSGIFTFK